MSSECKYHHNANVPNTQMSPKCKCHLNANVTQTQMSQKLKFHQNTNVTKMQMSRKYKCPKHKCHQNSNFAETEIFQRGLAQPGLLVCLSCDTCHMSFVTRQVSGVRCLMSPLNPNRKSSGAEILRKGSSPPTFHMS